MCLASLSLEAWTMCICSTTFSLAFEPEVIYHAAAFKHVPLLERNPIAAVRNNAIGTYTLAQAALRHGTPKLILISTDKAVNPHSVMGVSKRLAELAVVALSSPACRMNAIRLGNVIGSHRQRRPDFPEADRGAQARYCHASGSHPMVYVFERDCRCDPGYAGRLRSKEEFSCRSSDEPTRIADLAAFLIGAAGKSRSCLPGAVQETNSPKRWFIKPRRKREPCQARSSVQDLPASTRGT